MKRNIRLVVIGDDGVGRTSLISSLLNEAFSEDVPVRFPDITIPPEISPDNVETTIVDCSCDSVEAEEEIKRASVVCLVYAVDDIRSFHRLGTYWLPFIRSINAQFHATSPCPVILVGNKIDTRGLDVTNEELEEEILPLMSDFKEIETCVECSAKSLINVPEVFYFAQKAVLHPTAPLYDSKEHFLKPACVFALERIFHLCDTNKDGFLSDEEINRFQMKCFKIPLQKEELEGIKEVIKENDPRAVMEKGITKSGFIYLHQLFIQRGRLETTWTVLRRFGYDDNLMLKSELLAPEFPVPEGAVVSLSPKGYEFFISLFSAYDRDKDGALSWSEIEALFQDTCPENPWLSLGFPETTLTDSVGSVTMDGFLAQWSMTTLLNYRVTLEYLAYLGYNDGGSTVDALRIVPRGRSFSRRKERAQRDTFLCWVLGATGSGKTGILRNFIQRPFSETYIPTLTPYHTVNGVDLDGFEKFLVLEEIGSHNALDRELIADKDLLGSCDLICYVYDSSDPHSFSYIVDLVKENPELAAIPSLMVATKTDLPEAVQLGVPLQPEAFCRQHGIVGPIPVSVKEGLMANLYARLLDTTLRPPFLGKPSCWSQHPFLTAAFLSTVAAAGVIGAMAAYRLYHKKSNP